MTNKFVHDAYLHRNSSRDVHNESLNSDKCMRITVTRNGTSYTLWLDMFTGITGNLDNHGVYCVYWIQLLARTHVTRNGTSYIMIRYVQWHNG